MEATTEQTQEQHVVPKGIDPVTLLAVLNLVRELIKAWRKDGPPAGEPEMLLSKGFGWSTITDLLGKINLGSLESAIQMLDNTLETFGIDVIPDNIPSVAAAIGSLTQESADVVSAMGALSQKIGSVGTRVANAAKLAATGQPEAAADKLSKAESILDTIQTTSLPDIGAEIADVKLALYNVRALLLESHEADPAVEADVS